MTNYVHLAIQVGEVPSSRIIQNISFRYTRYINRRKKMPVNTHNYNPHT